MSVKQSGPFEPLNQPFEGRTEGEVRTLKRAPERPRPTAPTNGEGNAHSNGERTSYPAERTILEALVRYIAIVMRRKRLVFAMTAIAFLFSMGYGFISSRLPPGKSPDPNRYTATAALFVQGNQGGATGLVGTIGVPAPPQPGSGAPQYGEIALEVSASRPFLDSLARRFHVAQHYHITKHVATTSRLVILKHSKLKYDATTGTLQIQYTDIDPVFARDMANGIMNQIVEWFSTRVLSSASRDERFIGAKLEAVKDQMAKLNVRLADFQKQYGVLSVNELSSIQANILSNLRSQLVLTETEIQTRTAISRVDDPELTALEAQRESLLSTIRQVQDGVGPYGGTMPARRDLPALAQRMRALTTEMDIQNKIYENLSQQYELLKFDLQAQPLFQVLERADTPAKKSSPSRFTLVFIITFVGFLLSVVVALFLNVLPKAKRIYEREKNA